MIPPLVELIWEDFTSSHGWKTKEELDLMVAGEPKDYLIRSVGYLISKNDDRLVLVGTILDRNYESDQGEVVADMIRVPVSQVREMLVLERPE